MSSLQTLALPVAAYIGFDRVFDQLQKISKHATDTYPPHDVIKVDGKNINIEIAVAGFSKDDLSIALEDNVLTIRGKKINQMTSDSYVYKGISSKEFVKGFRLSEYSEFKRASLKDGILLLQIVNKEPKDTTPESIPIHDQPGV
jgi:molecular chaperone IbpA